MSLQYQCSKCGEIYRLPQNPEEHLDMVTDVDNLLKHTSQCFGKFRRLQI